MPRSFFTILTALLLTIALAGCDGGGSNDDDDDGGVQPGTFTASVEGDVTTSLSGSAVSTAIGNTWGIVLAPGQPQNMTFITSGVGRPPAGTFVIRRNELNNPVQAGEFYGSIVLELGAASSWFVRNGTLTLTSSTTASVAGTFSFTADRFVGDGQEVTVEGTFNTTNTGG